MRQSRLRNCGVQQLPDVGRLDKHSQQATTDEQNCDGNVLQVLGAKLGVANTGVAEMLQEDVGRTIEEDQSTLNKFGRGPPSL